MSDDLISRQAAIRKLQDKGEEPMYQHTDEDWKCGLFMAEDIITDLPTAGKVGRWIGSDDFDEYYRCSECGKGETQFGGLYRYCPNCGARMDEVTE